LAERIDGLCAQLSYPKLQESYWTYEAVDSDSESHSAQRSCEDILRRIESKLQNVSGAKTSYGLSRLHFVLFDLGIVHEINFEDGIVRRLEAHTPKSAELELGMNSHVLIDIVNQKKNFGSMIRSGDIRVRRPEHETTDLSPIDLTVFGQLLPTLSRSVHPLGISK
jgi:hypothetical protein